MNDKDWLIMDVVMAAGIFVGNYFLCMQETRKASLIVATMAAVIFFVARYFLRVFTGY